MIPTASPISFDHRSPSDLQRVASTPDLSVWVNASAGSGKTSVLTKRVMRLLLSGVYPEKILCLTYTRAGAAEMANRITTTLSKWAVCDEAALDKDLDDLQQAPVEPGQRLEARRLFARVISCPGGLRIRTIHSFCQEILSRFPIEAGLPPHFTLIDDDALHHLHDEVLNDLLREAAENPESELAATLAVLVAAKGESGFMDMLKEATRDARNFANDDPCAVEKLKTTMRRFLELAPDDTPEAFRRDYMARLPLATMKALASWWATGGKRLAERSQRLADILALPDAERVLRFNAWADCFLKADFNCYEGSFLATKDLLAKHPEIEDVYRQEAARLRSALERIEAAEVATITENVLSFGAVFAQRLAERKAARAALDYDDMIRFTEALLNREGVAPWVLYKLDNGIEHVLLDEAQDTSRAQWNIVQRLIEEFYAGYGSKEDKTRTLFVVGDEKQSIFSFQNADPESFLSLRDAIEERFAQARKAFEKVPMRTSFRSAPAILKAVDAVFASEEARRGVSAEPVLHHSFSRPGDKEKIGRVEVWPLLRKEKDGTSGNDTWILPTECEEERDPLAELAQAIALKIRSWLDEKKALPGEDRPLTPGDIMILLRRRGRFADLMVRALKMHNVPVTGVDRMHLVKQLPVMDLLAFAHFALLPEDDLNLATLLRGPLLGLSEDDLMTLALGREGSLWKRLKESSHTSLVAYLSQLLNDSDFSTPYAFLSKLLSAPCPANAASGRKALWARLGHEAIDPIEELLNKAQLFEQGHAPSLQNFVHWLTQSNVEIKRELDRTEGQVRIMTVHASKGLEAPIVFLPDTTSVPRSQDLDHLQWTESGVPVYLAQAPKFESLQQIWRRARDLQLQEYKRLLYVAMTRASRRLYIGGCSTDKNEGVSENSWYGLVLSALKSLHQEDFLVENGTLAPDVVFSDTLHTPVDVVETPLLPLDVSPLPDWAVMPLAAEATPVSTAPSYADDIAGATPDAAFARGRIIHRLLQSLPDLPPEKRSSAVQRFLAHPRHQLTPEQRDEIAGEVLNLVENEDYKILFNSEGLAEAPLAGILNGAKAFRQVDRLCLNGNEVWVVDYKTNRPPPAEEKDIPKPYRRQVEEYRELLRGIYPDKTVRCFLLWTYAPRLMEIH